MAVQALLILSALTGECRYYDLAAKTLSPIQQALSGYPSAFGNWLIGLDIALAELQEVAILGDLHNSATQALIRLYGRNSAPIWCWPPLHPHQIKGSPALLADRPLLDGQPTAYVCRNFVCQQPSHHP